MYRLYLVLQLEILFMSPSVIRLLRVIDHNTNRKQVVFV